MDDEVPDRTDQYKKQRKLNAMLLLACVRGAAEEVSALIELGAHVDAVDKAGYSAMHFAAAHGRTETLKLLWSKGGELEVEDQGGRTPLHIASLRGHVDAMNMLISSGAWLDAFDGRDDTPLHLAARANKDDAVAALLSAGARVNSINHRGLSALGEAVLAGNVQVAQRLKKGGAPLWEMRLGGGFTLLHVAAGAGEGRAVQWLCDAGCEPNDAANSDKSTPLHAAAAAGAPLAVECLLKAGADVAAVDASGCTALDLAVQWQGKSEGAPTAQEGEQGAGGGKRQYGRVLEILQTWHATPGQASAGGRGGGQTAQRQPGGGPGHASQQENMEGAAGVSGGGLKETFKTLTESERRARVQRWADKDPVELHVLLKSFTEEMRSRVVEVGKIKRLMRVHKAMCLLHEDDDFQSDMRKPAVRATLDKLRGKPSEMDKHMHDPVMRDVLDKLRRFQAYSKEQGFPKVNLEDLVPPVSLDIKELDRRQYAAFEEMLAAQTAAASAAGCEDYEGAAKKAADAASAASRKASHAREKGEAVEEEEKEKRVAPGRLDPTKQPETWGQAFQLYWQELGDLTWRNDEYKRAFVQKCFMSVIFLVLGLIGGYIGRHLMPDLGEKLIRWGPGTFSPAGILQGADERFLKGGGGNMGPGREEL